MESIFNLQEKYPVDESIISFETYAYEPISGTQYNNPGQITIRIENTDAFFYPRRSWLQVEGNLIKGGTAGGAYTAAEVITIVNNAILYLFDNIRYDLSGQEIESLFNPGQATTMLGLAKYSSNFNSGVGLNQGWRIDSGDGKASLTTNSGFTERHAYFIKNPDPKGSFRLAIDLEHIFGFMEDYDKILYGFTQSLTLVRAASSNDAIFRTDQAYLNANAAVVDGVVKLSRIAWFMPKVTPSDVEKYELYKKINAQITLDVGFRMRQCSTISMPAAQTYTWRLGVRSAPEEPRYIMLAFQTDRANNQEKNTAVFDHCRLKNAYVLLNNVRYPAIDFNASFTKNQYENFYKDFAEFSRKYYGIDWLVTSTAVDSISYKAHHPIFIFDVSKQSERLQQGVVDIAIEMFFAANVTPATVAFALLISDRKLKFKSDGKKMTVIH